MQVTPRKIEQTVEVYLSYEPQFEEEVKSLLFDIENVYIEFVNDDI